MKNYLPYVEQLEKLANAALSGQKTVPSSKELDVVLNGEAGRQLRSAVAIDDLQSAGAFFTGQLLRDFALQNLPTSTEQGVYWDPACGAGDLLLGAANVLPISSELETTIQLWGSKLQGSDIHAEFVRATRARLVLSAYARGARSIGQKLSIADVFKGITINDSLEQHKLSCAPNFVLLNPPYNKVQVDKSCSWASGHVSAAAQFVEQATILSKPGTRIIAILPDVLRSGTRYNKWRDLMQQRCMINRIDVWGLFDSITDIDVFVLEMTIRESLSNDLEKADWQLGSSAEKILGDICHVSVGAVVPHRHLNEGPWRTYLNPQNAPAWSEVNHIDLNRRFNGTTVGAPFVVVRRTSNPKDKNRIIATLIAGTQNVAVENHLIVIKPIQPTLIACRQVMQILKSAQSVTWLNQRIRCRHLTVTAIREMPFLNNL